MECVFGGDCKRCGKRVARTFEVTESIVQAPAKRIRCARCGQVNRYEARKVEGYDERD